MGLVGAVLTAIAQPAPLTLMKPDEFVARPSRWLQAISRYRATVSAAPNFAYELAAEKIRDDEIEGVDLSSWVVALDGAEPVTASALSRFYERFRAVLCKAKLPVAAAFEQCAGPAAIDQRVIDDEHRSHEIRRG